MKNNVYVKKCVDLGQILDVMCNTHCVLYEDTFIINIRYTYYMCVYIYIYIGLINSYRIKKVEIRSLYSKLEIYQTPSLCLNPFKNRKSGLLQKFFRKLSVFNSPTGVNY